PSRQPGTGRRGRGPGAVATAAGEALVGVGIPYPRRTAPGTAAVRLDRAATALPGARLRGRLGSETGWRRGGADGGTRDDEHRGGAQRAAAGQAAGARHEIGRASRRE